MSTALGTVDAGTVAHVGADGSLLPAGRSPIDWWVVAEDRVHHPADEPSTRQARLDDTPVVETRVRVPGGDLAATAYVVAGASPLLVVELDNRSPAAVAVAFAGPVVADRPLHAPPAGAGLPDGSVLVPVGHRTSVRVAVAVAVGVGAGAPAPVTSVLATLPSPAQVVRGWIAQAGAGPRIVLPDDLAALLVRARCDAILRPGAADDEAARSLLGMAFRAGRGDRPDGDGIVHVAEAAEAVGRRNRRARELPWADAAALDAAAVLLADLDATAAADLRAMLARLPAAGPMPAMAPADDDPLLTLAWLTARLVRTSAAGVELLAGADRSWLGASVEAHDVPTAFGPVGVAIRWHGDRPAVLWSCGRAVPLSCPVLDPAWTTTDPSGEALLAPPPASLVG